MKKPILSKEFIVSAILSFIHFCVTFFTDPIVFTALNDDLDSSKLFNYVFCKVILLLLLFFIYRTLFRIIINPDRKSTIEYQIIKYAGIYFIPIIAVLIFKLPQGFLSNDESLIFAEAASLNSYTWFYYLTTYYYIICLMLIPAWFGPVLVKVVIQLLVCGYVVYRIKKYTHGSKFSYLMYLSFLLPPVLAYTTSAHRIPVYYLLYLLLFFILLMDMLENVIPSKQKLFWILLLCAILTQWRTEGIYLAVTIPILIFIAYKTLRTKKSVLIIILSSLVIQYAVAIPQYGGLYADRLGDQANNRMGPFWAYTITNMFRNGLDLEKNAKDLELVNRYIDVETIKAINNDLGDINYEDALILYFEGYTGLKPEATVEDYIAYTEGCKNIFLNNPDVLVKTKFGSFDYAARPYHMKPGIVNRCKDIVYDLYAPLLFIFLIWGFSIIRKKGFLFFATSSVLCHFAIVFILSPASYFKYYFPIYMMGYFYIILGITLCISTKKDLHVRGRDANPFI